MQHGAADSVVRSGDGLVRLAISAGVVVLAVTGLLFDAITPWAYLNVVGGIVLAGFARAVLLRFWWAIVALPLWQLGEVSLYSPWVDPGIPISLFVNPLLGLAVLATVLSSPIDRRG